MEIKKIMVIGAGQMGSGIAQVAAEAGMDVVLNDIKTEFAEKGFGIIVKNLSKNVAKQKITQEDMDWVLSKIQVSADLKDAADCDLVVEAIVEDIAVKGALYKQLDMVCKKETIFASNTSSLPITQIASYTNRPEKVIGMHFSNPVPVMKFLEVIKGKLTSDETFETIMEMGRIMGKEPVEAKDYPGFGLNKIYISMLNEAIYSVYEGIATPEGIDTLFRTGAGHKMGPIEVADLVGLDTVLHIMETLQNGYGDPKYRPCPLLKQYVAAGKLGRKTGEGFYKY